MEIVILLLFVALYVAFIVFLIASVWKTFSKAGQPGWAAIIPIYNLIVWLRIAGKPWWWMLLMFIPIVSIVIAIIATVEFARAFGKGGGFAVGLIFLPFIFYPILGFGSARYVGTGDSNQMRGFAPVLPQR
jgi:hypothetical protein